MTPHNKTTIEQLNKMCDKFNIRFCDSIFKGMNIPHTWYCKKHNQKHVHRLDKIRARGRMKCCSAELRQNSKIKEVKQFCLEHNIRLVGNYTGTQSRTIWECNRHKKQYEKTYFNLKRLKDKRLPCCQEAEPRESGSCVRKRYYTKQVREVAQSFGYELVDAEYLGIVYRHRWYCKRHNQIRITTFQSIKSGKKLRCCRGEEYSGPGHPNYNSSITDRQRIKDRRSDANKRWSKLVRTRDGHECQICGCNQNCVAHHMNSYMAYPDHRHDTNNGITLCRACHTEFHKLYGNARNTKEQFIEFVWSKI